MRTRRVLLATINYDHPQDGIRRSFEYVFGKDNVADFDYLKQERQGKSIPQINADFIYTATAFKPDWIWLQVQETNIILPDSLQLIKTVLPKTVITHWTGDYRPIISSYLASICQITDATFISNRGQLDLFRSVGAKEAFYLQIGVDWEEDVLGYPTWIPPFVVPSIVFIGNHYGGDAFPEGTAQRLSVIRAMQDAKLDIGVIGSGWPSDINVVGQCQVKQQHHVYKRAKIALSINHINNVDSYYSDRQLIAMASGTPVLAWKVPGLEREFRIDGTIFSHCLVFESSEEAVLLAKRLLANSDRRTELGYMGRYIIMRDHDWRNRVVEAVQIVDEELRS